MLELSDPIAHLHRIGKVTEPKLHRLDIETVGDLVWYLPKRYEDFSKVKKISDLEDGEVSTIKGVVKSLNVKRIFRRKRLVISEAEIDDGSGIVHATWFGQRYIDRALKVDDEVYLAGKPTKDLLSVKMVNPIYEKVKEEQLHTARIIPYYQLTEGISQKQFRFLVQTALESLPPLQEEIPDEIISAENLISNNDAVRQVHYPTDKKKLDEAIVRLKFEELFWLQLRAGYAKKIFNQAESPSMTLHESEVKKFVARLPFVLTNDQKKVSWTILKDLEKSTPTHRLIQGDVGSGKTVVASIAILNSILNKYQTVLMAPTELLVFQHYRELIHLFKQEKINLGLLTSKSASLNNKKASKKIIYNGLADGSIDCIIGTHSLIQDTISMMNLGLIIIDEQHRFGVRQRKRITEINQSPQMPHLISLTATPIPRTLALTLYGELEISTITEKPKGRRRIITKLVEEINRDKAYEFIQKKILQNEQIFVICPLIEESDSLETKSVLQEFDHLQKSVFPDVKIRFVHGKLKSDEKKKILQDFTDNKFSILVTTSVIEVGIDIPHATIMVIEGAERFGLSQLHQFRGRVGRSNLQSYCFLFSQSKNQITLQRLELLTKHNDGFMLAEADLKHRGEGEVFGTKQSGLVNFKIATIHDSELIKKSRAWVNRILSEDTHALWNDAMRKKLEDAESIHLE